VRRLICLPTYNEHENLEPMVRALGGLGLEGLDVLVIDDSSPDGTGEIADRLAAELPWVHVLHRERKEGLGPAYLAGFRRALELGADLVFEMDCDFSHDPKDVPRLAEATERADLVLGSRYVPGGGIRNWGFVRRFISRGGSLYPRPDRRLQVLSAAGAGDDRPRRDRLAWLRVPDRDDVPRAPRRLLGGRGPDSVLGP
jgi:dolichol-phosphate mannosyltransferase